MANPKLMSRADAIKELAFPCLLDNALQAGWIKPIGYTGSSRSAAAIYAARDVENVVARILTGDIPPNPRAKK